jgi:hypothetical protein
METDFTSHARKESAMAIDPRKRQKKLERRAAKRKSKQHVLVQERSAGLGQRMAAAAAYPVLDCGATEDIWTEGLGWLWLSRQLPNGSIAIGIFLIDRYCLGVKNAHADITGRFSYESEYLGKMRRKSRMRELAPSAARKLVEGAVAYARRFGFSPHPDYHKAYPIFGDIDAGACTEEFEFGKDGKPFFIGGPNDGMKRCTEIMHMLERSCGAGNFDVLIPLDPSGGVLREAIANNRTELLAGSGERADGA